MWPTPCSDRRRRAPACSRRGALDLGVLALWVLGSRCTSPNATELPRVPADGSVAGGETLDALGRPGDAGAQSNQSIDAPVAIVPGGGPDAATGEATTGGPLGDVRAIGAGASHTCAALGDGTVVCWGRDDHGQLGDGRRTTVPTPGPVAVVGVTGATAVSGGGGFLSTSHSCAMGAMSVQCWGGNAVGQLGDGAMADSAAPTSAMIAGNLPATRIAAGEAHTCVVVAGGTVQCWGGNGGGQLGFDPMSPMGFFSRTPVVVGGLAGAVEVATGASHSCAIVGTGEVRCWGTRKLLGDGPSGPTDPDYTVTPVGVSGIRSALALAASSGHTCAAVIGGIVRCWGTNTSGQLGDGTVNDATVPTAVVGLADAVTVAAGVDFTCALRRGGGTVSCWGSNAHGQLGDGTMVGSTTPVTVLGLIGVKALSAAWFHACALLGDSSVRCWGMNAWGELGDGTTADSPRPVTVRSPAR